MLYIPDANPDIPFKCSVVVSFEWRNCSWISMRYHQNVEISSGLGVLSDI